MPAQSLAPGDRKDYLKIGAVEVLQNWEIPSDLKDLHEYIKRMESRDSWKQTYYPPDKVRSLVSNMNSLKAL